MADLGQNLKDLRSVRGAAKAIDAKSLPAMTKRIQVLDLVERYIDYKRETHWWTLATRWHWHAGSLLMSGWGRA